MRLLSVIVAIAGLASLSLAKAPTDFRGLRKHINRDLLSIPLTARNNTQAECGPQAAAVNQTCPLNVCCSAYGFCGTTDDFCMWNNTQNPTYSRCDARYGSCGPAPKPICNNTGTANERQIGYYGAWAAGSGSLNCDLVQPEDLNLDGYTHINFAFASFNPITYQLGAMSNNNTASNSTIASGTTNATDTSLFRRFTALKQKKPGLEAWISIGGWAFTSPGPTQKAFSEMVSSPINRTIFINAAMAFMKEYGFDGLDLDWEYPGASDRGGTPSDKANLVTLTAEIKTAFAGEFGLTITLPAGYWHLRNFDLQALQKHVDWFNLMAYDLHGAWDATEKDTGPYIRPHTNLTEIGQALDLLWRAGANPDKVVLGEAQYGRSFTLKDQNCTWPGVCEFTGPGRAGECSNSAGILTYQEIDHIIKTKRWSISGGADRDAVRWIAFDTDQWVSFDNQYTFNLKRQYANQWCLGGTMVWAMDMVNQTSPSIVRSANFTVPSNWTFFPHKF